MATPPFTPDETLPLPTQFLSQYPGQSQLFRDIMESWLTFITDPTTGLLKAAAFPATLSIPGTVLTTGNLSAASLITAGRPPTIQTKTASGDYTKTAGARFLQVSGCGGGGGSGGINDLGTGSAATAGGGSGFSGWTPIIDLSFYTVPIAFLIGAGGTAGVGASASAGGTGGATTTTINGVAYSWGGGLGSDGRNTSTNTCAYMDGGMGGWQTGGLIGWSMQGYPAGISFSDDQVMAGAGGASMFGRGGEGRRSITPGASGGGLVGLGNGVGASGAFNNQGGSDNNGAAGMLGILYYKEWF